MQRKISLKKAILALSFFLVAFCLISERARMRQQPELRMEKGTAVQSRGGVEIQALGTLGRLLLSNAG